MAKTPNPQELSSTGDHNSGQGVGWTHSNTRLVCAFAQNRKISQLYVDYLPKSGVVCPRARGTHKKFIGTETARSAAMIKSIIASILLFCAATASADSISGLWNTGVDGSGNPLPNLGVDSHYVITTAPRLSAFRPARSHIAMLTLTVRYEVPHTILEVGRMIRPLRSGSAHPTTF